MQAIMALALAVGAAADVSEQSQGDNPTADVLVYGAALPGCVAAVAASRSGATRVVLTTPYLHVGGMTTGGLQHADPGNESTVAGITREFFDRVEARYAHAPPGPHHRQSEHTCRAGRCLEVTDGTGSPDSQCHKACPPLGPDEWLAVTFLSTLSDGNRTLTVTLPKGQASSFIKKSEKLAKDLPASSVKAVDQGQVLELSAPAVLVDQTYYRIQLKASPLARLVADTAQELSARRAASGLASAPGLHPGAPPGWLYEGHVAEEVLEEMLAEANVTIVRGLGGLVSATKRPGSPTTLATITAEGGRTFSARYWIDASYEGDLAMVAGAEMVWGREANTTYDEPGAGRQPPTVHYPVDPFWADGTVIPHVSNAPLAPIGSADKRMEVYTFRLCLTDSPAHRIPTWKPTDYEPAEWEFWRRLYRNGSSAPASLKSAGLGCARSGAQQLQRLWCQGLY